MLLKTARDVYVPSVPAADYRPYSKTCPPPPPPPHVKRWVNKKLCGTITQFAFFAYVTPTSYDRVIETAIAIPGLQPVISYDKSFLTTLPSTDPVLVTQSPYCVMVKVYE